jgi:hypothetical protein
MAESVESVLEENEHIYSAFRSPLDTFFGWNNDNES